MFFPGKCYAFAPGLTIPGADYRRDFGLSRRECAEVCKSERKKHFKKYNLILQPMSAAWLSNGAELGDNVH